MPTLEETMRRRNQITQHEKDSQKYGAHLRDSLRKMMGPSDQKTFDFYCGHGLQPVLESLAGARLDQRARYPQHQSKSMEEDIKSLCAVLGRMKPAGVVPALDFVDRWAYLEKGPEHSWLSAAVSFVCPLRATDKEFLHRRIDLFKDTFYRVISTDAKPIMAHLAFKGDKLTLSKVKKVELGSWGSGDAPREVPVVPTVDPLELA